jgi:hypothetical protein
LATAPELAERGRLASPAPGAAGPAGKVRDGGLVEGELGLSELARQKGGEAVGPNPTDRGKPGSKHHLHRGEFMGVAPTGNQVEMGAMDLVRVAGGKIAETWSNVDMMTMMRQLGAIPTPARSGESGPT